jgi:hypothetical protein
MEDKEFWDRLVIPFQEEDLEFEFANDITVQRGLLVDQSLAAYIGHMVERLEEELALLEYEKAEKQRELSTLRRAILAENYDKITKTASSEVQEAFIYRCAVNSHKDASLLQIEAEIESLTRRIEIKTPLANKYRGRLKQVDKKSERATNYLNHEGRVMKVSGNAGRH